MRLNGNARRLVLLKVRALATITKDETGKAHIGTVTSSGNTLSNPSLVGVLTIYEIL